MKGHVVPWGFLPNWFQFVMAIAMVVVVVMNTHHNMNAARRWWPWLLAVAAVLMTPVLTSLTGFEPQGIRAKSLAAELQSFAATSGLSWLSAMVSTLQTISTKGMGLRTAGVVFTAGGAFGRLAVVPGFDRFRVAFLGQPQVLDGQQRQPLQQEQQQEQEQQQQHQQQQEQLNPEQHPHRE